LQAGNAEIVRKKQQLFSF